MQFVCGGDIALSCLSKNIYRFIYIFLCICGNCESRRICVKSLKLCGCAFAHVCAMCHHGVPSNVIARHYSDTSLSHALAPVPQLWQTSYLGKENCV